MISSFVNFHLFFDFMCKAPKETRTKTNINVCSKSRRFEYLMIILTSKRERETIFFMTMFAVSKRMSCMRRVSSIVRELNLYRSDYILIKVTKFYNSFKIVQSIESK